MSVREHADATGMSFRQRRRREEALARVRDLDDHDLAALVVTHSAPDHELACEVLADRFLPQLLRRARMICRHLGHCGEECRGNGCEQAFESAMGELASRITGQRYSYAYLGDAGGRWYTNSAGRARRSSAPKSAASRWFEGRRKRADLALAATIGADLKQSGRTADVRRRWNLDRGLKSRANLPASLKQEANDALVEHVERNDTVGQHIGSSNAGCSAQAWADRFYDDACDNARHQVIGPDDKRLARSLGWLDGNGEPTDGMVATLRMVTEVLTVDDGVFWEAHMGTAYQQTRSRQMEPPERPETRRTGPRRPQP